MFTILPESTDTSIGFKISGKVTSEDYEVIVPKLDEAIRAHGKVNLLMVMGDFDGISGLDAAKADYKLGTHQYRQVEKAAFVSDKKWLEWVVKIMDPFTRRTDERLFELDQLDEAWQWVLGDD
jgi:hypothetical protein